MKTRLLTTQGTGPLIGALALSCLAVSAQGQQYGYSPPPGYSQPAPPQYPSQAPAYPQQGYGQPQYQTEYVSPMEFLPTFGRKFGDMFRRVFYGDSQTAPGYSPHGYPMPGSGRSLDSAPPAYESHYGQQPRAGIIDPRYQQAPGYPQQQGFGQPGYSQPAPRYQEAPPRTQPGVVPQYQTPPPPQRQAAAPSASQPGSRMGSTPPPRTSVKPAPAPAPKITQSPPKKYIPPTITKKSSPAVEEMPPPASNKKDTAAAEQTEYYPLPGAKPKTGEAKPSTSSSSKPSTGSTAGNNGAFLKGKRASKEGRVISPYPPYQELDVTGLSSGSLALDPTTQKVFEVP